MPQRLLIAILLFCCFPAFTQNTIGLPDIINFKKLNYNAGTQNWCIQQGANGMMYFANNEGLLCFDGTYWKIYSLPNKTIVRSIEMGKDNRIYVGGQDEIGYFSPDKSGTLVYHSLKGLLPQNHQSFTDIWKIISYGNDIFFQSSDKIFQFRQNTIKVYNAASKWLFLGRNGNNLLAQDGEKGLLQFDGNNWTSFIEKKDLPLDIRITGICAFGQDSSFITSWNNGLFLLSGHSLTSLPTDIGIIKHMTGVVPVDNGLFAVSTSSSGCYILSGEGKVLQRFWRSTGLQNNNIITLFQDKHQNLWLGLDSGIDFIAFNNAIKHINPENLDEGAGYAAIIYKNALYFGLSNGIYQLPLTQIEDISYSKNSFIPVKNTEGQIWGLSHVNGHLLAGSHEGVLQINGDVAIPIKKGQGFWQFTNFSSAFSAPLIVGGHYNGLTFFTIAHNTVTPLQSVRGFSESARFLTMDTGGAIWTSHPYRGIYKIDAPNTPYPIVKLYTDKNGLPSALNNHIFKIRNRIVVATEKGIYEYDAANDQFSPSAYFSSLFQHISPQYLKEDGYGNIWFIKQKMLGVADFSKGKPQIIYIPELNGKMISGFEHIYPIDRQNILVGAEKGFYHINYDRYRKASNEISVQIGTVKAIGKKDSTLFGGYFAEVNALGNQKEKSIPRIHHEWNSIHLEYSSPLFEQKSNLEYSYHLKGFDRQWSEWSKKTEKDYTNLPAGSYTFQVKARNNLGNESVVAAYSFVILPPWYQTTWAYSFYIIMFAAFAFLLHKREQRRFLIQQQKYQEEQRRLQYLHQLELEKSEKEIIKLKNEKLETEIVSKNSELASTTMHLMQKGELLVKVKDELTRLDKSSKQKEETNDLKKVIRKLSEEERIDQDWEQFAIRFNQVYNNFLIVLKEKFPDLNANELKLCAYLRMNLATKEIAQLMNISVRGVETGRYRLRKKLGIPTEKNLFEFLLNLHATKEHRKEGITVNGADLNNS